MNNKLKIIDVLKITQDDRALYPGTESVFDCAGTVLILEELSIPTDRLPGDSDVLVRPPGGKEFAVRVGSSKQIKGVASLFLRNYSGPPIPRLSEVSW
jgi:hypothetical protein